MWCTYTGFKVFDMGSVYGVWALRIMLASKILLNCTNNATNMI
jgi:hypothetical protein